MNTEPYHSPMNGCNCQAEVALPDGTIVRGVIGDYLPHYDVPQSGYTQRSVDRGRSWDEPVPVMDPERFHMQPKRLRLLGDGRLVLVGGFCATGPDIGTRSQRSGLIKPAIWVSADGGRSWSAPLMVVQPGQDVPLTEESDFAELADGRLLFVTRADAGEVKRWQSIVVPDGDGFRHASCSPAPFPHSGHPEMLAAREGVALHLATSGISWTADAGKTWHDLGVGGTGYNPRSLQLPDGRILCVAHRGGDNPYDGSVDQEIQALTFRLRVAE